MTHFTAGRAAQQTGQDRIAAGQFIGAIEDEITAAQAAISGIDNDLAVIDSATNVQVREMMKRSLQRQRRQIVVMGHMLRALRLILRWIWKRMDA